MKLILLKQVYSSIVNYSRRVKVSFRSKIQGILLFINLKTILLGWRTSCENLRRLRQLEVRQIAPLVKRRSLHYTNKIEHLC